MTEIYHHCENQGSRDVFKTYNEDYCELGEELWFVEFNRDGWIPILFCPFCGKKLN